jgi:4-alpha-glucanotransferase
MEILREIYAANEAAIAKDAALAKWIDGHSWVKPYAVFRRLKEANGEKSWQEWSPAAKSGKTPENIPAEIDRLWNDAKLRGEHLFWAWLQKALDEQFLEAAKAVRGAGILLEGDLPILMNEDSCDVWAHRGIFRMDLSAGAPPDMYSPAGQNWGFPIYHWDEQAKDNYAWWRARLAAASSYYDCYRIDHVLGFFRIWASSRADNSSALGRFVPYLPITTKDLAALGFDKNRIRWLSRPHLPTGEVWDGIRAASIPEHEVADAANKSFELALDRIGGEELWLFKDKIKGEKDIEALGLPPAAVSYLTLAWHNRLFYEYESGKFFPVWYFRDSRAYNSLSQEEKDEVEALVEKRRVDSEKIWEKEGQKLLSVLIDSSHMLPCAEDLGAVPDCVPKVLAKLKILGLRVVRWHRLWDEEGQPYIPFNNYPELSVGTPSVHDSSTLREWWDTEADQEHFSAFLGVPSLPKVYNPGTAKIILKHCAAAASRFRVFQIQDVLNLSQKWYGGKAQDDRINVPGTANEFNWTYRLPASIETIKSDAALAQEVKELGA